MTHKPDFPRVIIIGVWRAGCSGLVVLRRITIRCTHTSLASTTPLLSMGATAVITSIHKVRVRYIIRNPTTLYEGYLYPTIRNTELTYLVHHTPVLRQSLPGVSRSCQCHAPARADRSGLTASDSERPYQSVSVRRSRAHNRHVQFNPMLFPPALGQ